jgi:hypothetical protein
VQRESTSSADGWRQLVLAFDTGQLAPLIDLRYTAPGSGTAYFSDFSLKKLPQLTE